MVTQEQVRTHDTFHSDHPKKRGQCCTWRKNGQLQTWKRDLARFKQPVKYGLYEHGYITNDNAHLIHLPEDCPNATE